MSSSFIAINLNSPIMEKWIRENPVRFAGNYRKSKEYEYSSLSSLFHAVTDDLNSADCEVELMREKGIVANTISILCGGDENEEPADCFAAMVGFMRANREILEREASGVVVSASQYEEDFPIIEVIKQESGKSKFLSLDLEKLEETEDEDFFERLMNVEEYSEKLVLDALEKYDRQIEGGIVEEPSCLKEDNQVCHENDGEQKKDAVSGQASAAKWEKLWNWIEEADGSLCLTRYKGNDNSPTIPTEIEGRHVTTVGCGAFCDCISLKKVEIPKYVKRIEGSAFRGCKNLTCITIPEGVTSIGGYAFYGCSNLANLRIPASVVEIDGYDPFYRCPLISICAPAGSYAEQYAKTHGIPIVVE